MIEGRLHVTAADLNLALTLMSGQSFRWKALKDCENSWFGVVGDYALVLTQSEHYITYRVLNDSDHSDGQALTSTTVKLTASNKRRKVENNNGDSIHHLLSDYFRLDVSLKELYASWSESDTNFARIADRFTGVRLLRQSPVENLFSFICSSNNHISRISKMVDNLCLKYGRRLCDANGFGPLHAFPAIHSLANDAVESELKTLGFGYRAKFINKSAKMILEKEPNSPEKWLLSLRDLSYEMARKELTQLSGIGAKVADCICLMSLSHYEAIPVDTHVWKIACDHYLPHLRKNKSLSDKAYNEIGHFFREKFGPMAGWAHNVLFCSHLKQFSHLLR